MRRCGTTPDGNHRDRFRRALSQVAARPSRRAPAPACRGPVPTFFVGDLSRCYLIGMRQPPVTQSRMSGKQWTEGADNLVHQIRHPLEGSEQRLAFNNLGLTER